MFKDELGGKIMKEFVGLRAKRYSYLIDSYNDKDYEKNKIINKTAKGTKKCIKNVSLCLITTKSLCLIINSY